ncbi:MAG: major capsid protein [Chloroflexota bacterium]
MEPLNIRDQYVLTLAVRKLVRTETFRGREVAPIVPTNNRKFKMTVREADLPLGIGQFKAPNADTPVADIRGQLNPTTVTYISAVDLEEMVLLEETDHLESADALVRMNKIDEIIDMGRLLQLRNERLTELMRWKAFQNALTIEFQNGEALTVDSYGQYGTGANSHIITDPGNNNYRNTDWNDVDNSRPLDDLHAWQDLIENDAGFPAEHIWMSRQTFRNFQRSAQWAEFLTFVDRTFRLVTQEDISRLVDIPNFHIYEGSWKDNDGVQHKYLPDDYVLITTAPTLDGIRIAETYDAPVVRYQGGRLQVQRNPGMNAETWVDPLKKQEFLRVSTARMVHLMFPEAIAYAYVGA